MASTATISRLIESAISELTEAKAVLQAVREVRLLPETPEDGDNRVQPDERREVPTSSYNADHLDGRREHR